MKIYGIDFTSAPSKKKGITSAECEFDKGLIRVNNIANWPNFELFERFLKEDGTWIAGIDFPFGQPRKLIKNLDWLQDWEKYVDLIDKKGKEWFENILTDYKKYRPYGDKEHLRFTDKKANSFSPMKLYRPPVGKMFFQGAPRILKCGASILPFLDRNNNKIIIEAYPNLVARTLIGRRGYKNDTLERRKNRENIFTKLITPENEIEYNYGFNINLSQIETEDLITELTADKIDAIFCAIQAAWAYTRKSENYGIPIDCDKLEGWIVDPHMLKN